VAQWDRIEELKIEEGVFPEGGKNYRYVVLRPEFEPQLPNFVGWNHDMTVLVISVTTPVEYRRFILAHEIICRIRLASQSGRCRQALEIELSRVPPEIKADYIAFRLRFFEGLVALYSNSSDIGFKLEIQASLDHLRSL
jgi:hypothetical protein